ncbi:MAG: hypothetical protein Q4C47_02730, partial [Planctomycetia bacterium]|nr:hypothetical protein [Planctomycetia bacterium]
HRDGGVRTPTLPGRCGWSEVKRPEWNGPEQSGTGLTRFRKVNVRFRIFFRTDQRRPAEHKGKIGTGNAWNVEQGKKRRRNR